MEEEEDVNIKIREKSLNWEERTSNKIGVPNNKPIWPLVGLYITYFLKSKIVMSLYASIISH